MRGFQETPSAPALPPDEHTPRPQRFEAGEGGLRRRVARGTIINAAFSVGLGAVGLLKGLAAAAFMAPGEYGVWGLLIVSIGTLFWLKQVGIGDKYVQQDEPDQELAFQRAFSLEVVLTALPHRPALRGGAAAVAAHRAAASCLPRDS